MSKILKNLVLIFFLYLLITRPAYSVNITGANTINSDSTTVQTYNDQQVRQVQDMTETRLMKYQQEQYREQQRWLAYIMMMQFFAKENMWSLLNQMRIQRTLDITA